jgi:hypothetical protein
MRFVVKRQVDLLEVCDLELPAAVFGRPLDEPVGDGFSDPPLADACDHD